MINIVQVCPKSSNFHMRPKPSKSLDVGYSVAEASAGPSEPTQVFLRSAKMRASLPVDRESKSPDKVLRELELMSK